MALRDILARFGVSVDSRPVTGFNKRIEGSIATLKKLGVVIGGSILLSRLKTFTTELIDTGDEIGKTSKILGISTESLQSWRFAVGQSGSDAKTFETAAKSLNKNAFEAGVRGSKAYVESFERLNVSVTDGQGNLKEFDELFLDVGVAIGEMTNQTEKSALATQLFGRSGQKLLPFFNQGRAGIEATRKEIQKYGGGLSREAVAKTEEAQDALARLDIGFLSLKGRLATTFLPILVAVGDKLAEFAGDAADATEGTSILEAILVAAGVAAIIFGQNMFLAMIKALPVIGLVIIAVLILEDAIGTLQGKDSVIKDVFDSFAGAGRTENQVKRLNAAIDKLLEKDFGGFTTEAIDIFASFGEVLFQGILVPIQEGFGQLEIWIEEGLEAGAVSIVEWFAQLESDIESGISDAASGLVESMGQLAGDMIGGFVAEMQSGKMVGAAVDAVKSALVGANTEAGTKSPSTKTRKIAQFFSEGWALGLSDRQPQVNRATAQMVSRSVSVLGASVQQTNHISQTISGVSNPREAADRANRGIVGQAQTSFDSALESLVAVA